MTTFTTGDNAPPLSGRVNADLTGASVELHVQKPDGTVLTVPAAVTDAANGAWAYSWAGTDLDQRGDWRVEAQVTYSSGAVQTFEKAWFSVEEQIG